MRRSSALPHVVAPLAFLAFTGLPSCKGPVADTGRPADSEVDEADTTAPVVSFLEPTDGEALAGVIDVSVSATDAVGVVSVRIYLDGSEMIARDAAPWSVSWDTSTVPNGDHRLQATAADDAGNASNTYVDVTVNGGAIQPSSFEILQPLPGATICGSLGIEAAPLADFLADASVESVLFERDGEELGIDAEWPYRASWDTGASPDGTHLLSATLTDTEGNAVRRTIEVASANSTGSCDTWPDVTFAAPVPFAGVLGDTVIDFGASDDVGITGMRLSLDGTVVLDTKEDSSAEALPTATLVDGLHVLEALAWDSSGQQARSLLPIITDQSPPSVEISSPASSSLLAGIVPVQGRAEDNIGLASVDLLVDGAVVDSLDAKGLTSTDFELDWDTSFAAWGAHVIEVGATDTSGQSTTDRVDVLVDNPPRVTFTSPVADDVLSGVVRIAAVATDDTRVTSVAFFKDTDPIGTVDSEPYEIEWDTCPVPRIASTLLAAATDDHGNTGFGTVMITIDQPIEVAFSEPSGTINALEEVVTLVADDESLRSVALSVDAAEVADFEVVSTPDVPCSLGCGICSAVAGTWDASSLTDGTHTLLVMVTNSSGDVASTSTTVQVDTDQDDDGYVGADWGGPDCNDSSVDFHPGATEICDGLDQDCDDFADEDFDADADGYFDMVACGDLGTDCLDTNADVHPGATEICDNGLDDDCDSSAGSCGLLGEISIASADARFFGTSDASGFGTAAAAGDVDGDGLDDLIIGAPMESTTATYGGVTGLFLGHASGDSTLDDADARLWGADEDDVAGQTLAMGDLDGDGFAEPIIGAYQDEENGEYSGTVYAFLDPPTGDVSVTDGGVTIHGERANDHAGSALSVGDYNDDGSPDLTIGANAYSGGTYLGAAYVLNGPIVGTFYLTDTGAARRSGETNDDQAGSALASGDTNGDGCDDLLIGAPNRGTTTYDGSAYLVTGPIIGRSSLSTADSRLDAEHAGDWAGASVALGDLDGDGLDDLVVGAVFADGAATDSGEVYVSFSPAPSGSKGLASAELVIVGSNPEDYLGRAVFVSDVDGDGSSDLIVGLDGSDTAGTDAGAAAVFYAPSAGSLTDADADVLIGGETAGDHLATLVTVGQMNDDSFGDLILGAVSADSETVSNAGAVYVLFGGGI